MDSQVWTVRYGQSGMDTQVWTFRDLHDLIHSRMVYNKALTCDSVPANFSSPTSYRLRAAETWPCTPGRY